MSKGQIDDELPGQVGEFSLGDPHILFLQLTLDLFFRVPMEEDRFSDMHENIIAESAAIRFNLGELL